jgi:hypothetical protein
MLQSSDQQLLPDEKNIRDSKLRLEELNTNFYSGHNDICVHKEHKLRSIINKASTSFVSSHTPTTFIGSKSPNITYDRFILNSSTPDMLVDDKSPLILPFFYETS